MPVTDSPSISPSHAPSPVPSHAPTGTAPGPAADTDTPSVGALAVTDIDPAPADTATVTDTDVLAVDEQRMLLRAAERLLDDVDRALSSLDEGTYGTCGTCGTPLDDRDLEEDPLLARCSQHREPLGG